MMGHASILDPDAIVALDFRASIVSFVTSGFFYSLVRTRAAVGVA
jgi:hypothetical protein